MAVKPTDSGQDQSDKQIEPAEKQAEDNQPGDARGTIGVHAASVARPGGSHPGRQIEQRPAARGALSERKSGLEIGFDAGKTTQDAIGPASRRPTSCGFVGR